MSTAKGLQRDVTIYRADNAPDLRNTDFGLPAEDASVQISGAVGAAMGNGAQATLLARQAQDEGGFSLVYLWLKADFPLFRHSYDSDGIYYIISGRVMMDSHTLRAGDIFFVPADVPYAYSAGPDGAEVLEIRHGVDQVRLTIPEQSSRFQEMEEIADTHRERWISEQTSPTWKAHECR